MLRGLLGWVGGSRVGVWAITRVVARLDRRLYRLSGGRVVSTGRAVGPLLLLTTTGRRSGQERTTPVFYLRDGQRLVICHVNMERDMVHSWTANLRANRTVRAQVGRESGVYHARDATAEEVERFWPALTQIWPAYQTHFEQSGQRFLYILDPERN